MLRKLTQLAHRCAHCRFVERLDGRGTELAVLEASERQIELCSKLLSSDFCNLALVTSFGRFHGATQIVDIFLHILASLHELPEMHLLLGEASETIYNNCTIRFTVFLSSPSLLFPKAR